MDSKGKDMDPLFETIVVIYRVLGNEVRDSEMLASTIDYNDYVGRLPLERKEEKIGKRPFYQ